MDDTMTEQIRTSPLEPASEPGSRRAISRLVLVAVLLAPPLFAQDERDPGWYDSAELSFVSTSGNSEGRTLGFKNLLERLWEDARFSLDARGIRVESEAGDRVALGTPDVFRVVDRSDSEVTAENYSLRGRYDRDITETSYWFAGAGWERNEFAGFDSRIRGIVGAGNHWWEGERGRFATDYGLTWTRQDDLVENPDLDDSFLGLHLGWDFHWNFNDRTSYANELLVDTNLDETEDLRADMLHSLSVSMTDRLALKVSYQLLWDDLPALEEVPLLAPDGTPTGTTVLAELDELDTVLTTALVITFP